MLSPKLLNLLVSHRPAACPASETLVAWRA